MICGLEVTFEGVTCIVQNAQAHGRAHTHFASVRGVVTDGRSARLQGIVGLRTSAIELAALREQLLDELHPLLL